MAKNWFPSNPAMRSALSMLYNIFSRLQYGTQFIGCTNCMHCGSKNGYLMDLGSSRIDGIAILDKLYCPINDIGIIDNLYCLINVNTGRDL
jgi:hypothetical protein